jgi:hypothetical protein
MHYSKRKFSRETPRRCRSITVHWWGSVALDEEILTCRLYLMERAGLAGMKKLLTNDWIHAGQGRGERLVGQH